MTKPLAYLGTPYTLYAEGRIVAFRKAAKLTADLILSGVNCYSPICHGHPLSDYGAIDPLDQDFWAAFNELMMARCDVLIVAHMPGWDESSGIAHEIKYFLNAGKPIFDLNPETLAMIRRPEPSGVSPSPDTPTPAGSPLYAHGKTKSEHAGPSA